MGLNDINSLSHSKWNCKYPIVFAPKYIRNQLEEDKLGDQLSIAEVGYLSKKKSKLSERSWQKRLRVGRVARSKGYARM